MLFCFVLFLFLFQSVWGAGLEAAAAVTDLKHLNQSYESHDYARARARTHTHTHAHARVRAHARNTDTTSTERLSGSAEPSSLSIANKR